MALVPPETAGILSKANRILTVKFAGPKKSVVLLADGFKLEVTEDLYIINKRIEDQLRAAKAA